MQVSASKSACARHRADEATLPCSSGKAKRSGVTTGTQRDAEHRAMPRHRVIAVIAVVATPNQSPVSIRRPHAYERCTPTLASNPGTESYRRQGAMGRGSYVARHGVLDPYRASLISRSRAGSPTCSLIKRGAIGMHVASVFSYRVRTLVCAACVAVAASGCGLMVQGSTQTIRVVTSPEGALASIAGTGIRTPGEIEVERGEPWLIVRASKDGYQPTCEVVGCPRSIGLAVWDGLLFSAIPLAMDSEKRALRKCPAEVELNLEELPSNSPATALPSDSEILKAWGSGKRNLCDEPQVVSPAPRTPSSGGEDRFKELQRLRDQGLITQEEYDQKRAELLKEL